MTEQFWESRPVLRHVLTLSRARGAGPWAVFGAAAARAVATIPPEITAPGIVGGRMSLNLFIAHVGPSGGGKGIAEAVAADGFNFPPLHTVPLGSGEGIARTFRPTGTKPDDPNVIDTAIFTAPEIDSMAAIANRTGSTLSAELRKVYSGEQLGFANAGKETRNVVAAGSYRACLTVGVQPLRSQTLLGASDGGLPQRFVWLPTSDPDAPDDPPADPGRWKISRPSWLHAVGQHQDLIVPEIATAAIRSHRLAVLREDPAVDALDGHALLTRLKVAVALMALDGRTVVGEEDWKLAGWVMDVSNYTRHRCQRALAEHSRRSNVARALAAADRDEVISDRKLQRCKEGILRFLGRLSNGQIMSRSQLTRSIKSDLRDYFDAAIAELVYENQITAVRTAKGMAYAGPTVDQRSNPSEQRKHGLDHGPPLDQPNQRQRNRTRGKNRPNRQSQQTSESEQSA